MQTFVVGGGGSPFTPETRTRSALLVERIESARVASGLVAVARIRRGAAP
jgi:hypothetical protein